jgi:tRNA dimethylallyltransferase
MNQIIVLCGPTASGKSQIAMDIAKRINGVIVNADALQVYSQLPIITSSPSKEDTSAVRHELYNHIDVTETYSVAKYVADATNIIKTLPQNQTAIVVGGTGLYINSLIYGMHQIPDIDKHLREGIRKEAELNGIETIYEKLRAVDSVSASKLNALDIKRICRAYEVFMQTGKPIYSFYTDENFYIPLSGYEIKTYCFMPEREFLYQNCDSRFESFLNKGAINEAASLLESWNDWNTTAKKALGLEEIISYLQGNLSLLDAKTKAQQHTRNFAKRQITWFKNQLGEHVSISFANDEEYHDNTSKIAL